MARSRNGERNRGHQKDDGRPGGGFGENRRGTAWSEGGLAAHASEGRGDVTALAALQQNHDNQKQTNCDVDDRNQYDHELSKSSTGIFRRSVFSLRVFVPRIRDPRENKCAGEERGFTPASIADLLYDAAAAEHKLSTFRACRAIGVRSLATFPDTVEAIYNGRQFAGFARRSVRGIQSRRFSQFGVSPAPVH